MDNYEFQDEKSMDFPSVCLVETPPCGFSMVVGEEMTVEKKIVPGFFGLQKKYENELFFSSMEQTKQQNDKHDPEIQLKIEEKDNIFPFLQSTPVLPEKIDYMTRIENDSNERIAQTEKNNTYQKNEILPFPPHSEPLAPSGYLGALSLEQEYQLINELIDSTRWNQSKLKKIAKINHLDIAQIQRWRKKALLPLVHFRESLAVRLNKNGYFHVWRGRDDRQAFE